MSRRVYLLGLGLALVALALAVTDAALGPSTGVTEANVRRIRPGMPLAEVEALMGGRGKPLIGFRGLVPEEMAGRWIWVGSDGLAWVGLDGTARVVEVEWWPSAESSPGPLARLRDWLGW
jgi:hypothetical protein